MPDRARRAVPALVSVAAVIVLGVVALRVGDASLRAAEDDRLAARAGLVRTTLGVRRPIRPR